jgi:CheY-like chemotaxis protein
MKSAPHAERARIAAALRAATARLDAAADDAMLDIAILAALVEALEDVIAGSAATATTGGAADASAGGSAAKGQSTPAPDRARIIHDLRSTGGTLLTWCHLMRRGGISQTQLAHGTTVMEQAVRRLVSLVERLVAGGTSPAASGSTTSASLPATGAAADESTAPSTIDLHGVRILIVDDDADAREAMRMMLALHGADVSTAVSAIDAFDVLQQGRPDVLISDIVMPDADGYALLRRVRAPDTGDRGLIPAIAVTGRGREADRTHALAAGYQCQLTKPIVPAELIAAVHGLLAR